MNTQAAVKRLQNDPQEAQYVNEQLQALLSHFDEVVTNEDRLDRDTFFERLGNGVWFVGCVVCVCGCCVWRASQCVCTVALLAAVIWCPIQRQRGLSSSRISAAKRSR